MSTHINEMINKLVKASFPPKYMHATKFNPANPKVYYSGPYWDQKEIEAAM